MRGNTKSSLKKIKEEEAKKSDEKTNKNKTEQITKKSEKDEVKNNG